MADPRYPIGKFSYDGPLTAEQKQQYLTDIEQTPARFRAALAGLSDSQLNTPYRDGGWTPRQLAHHPTSVSNLRSPRTNQPSSLTQKISGQSCPRQRTLRWRYRWHCSIHCINAGCLCSANLATPSGNALFDILHWVQCRSRRLWRCTPGTGAITWHMSPA